MTHYVKRGDAVTLRWDLGRDLTAVTTARVVIATKPGATPVIDRAGVIEDADEGTPLRRIVSLALTPADYGASLLEAEKTYYVEVETEPGPLTHPNSTYETLRVVADLG